MGARINFVPAHPVATPRTPFRPPARLSVLALFFVLVIITDLQSLLSPLDDIFVTLAPKIVSAPALPNTTSQSEDTLRSISSRCSDSPSFSSPIHPSKSSIPQSSSQSRYPRRRYYAFCKVCLLILHHFSTHFPQLAAQQPFTPRFFFVFLLILHISTSRILRFA